MLQGQLYRKDVCILRNLVSNPISFTVSLTQIFYQCLFPSPLLKNIIFLMVCMCIHYQSLSPIINACYTFIPSCFSQLRVYLRIKLQLYLEIFCIPLIAVQSQYTAFYGCISFFSQSPIDRHLSLFSVFCFYKQWCDEQPHVCFSFGLVCL